MADDCERTPLWWTLKGIVLFPWHILAWSTWQCSWGYTMDHKRETLRWRLSMAWTMWLHRYWW